MQESGRVRRAAGSGQRAHAGGWVQQGNQRALQLFSGLRSTPSGPAAAQMSGRRPATGAKPKTPVAQAPAEDELLQRLAQKEAQLGCAADKLER